MAEEEKKGCLDEYGSTTSGKIWKKFYDLTENEQYWNMMVKTGPQRRGDGF